MERVKQIILLVSNDHYTDQRMQRICKTLYRNGYKVTVIGRSLGNPALDYGYDVVLLSLKNQSGPLFYWELMKSQINYVKSSFSAVDIVCTIDTDTLLAGKKIVNLFNCKHVHDAHEWFTEVPELKGKWFKRLIWSWVEKRCLKNIDLGYTVVERIGKHYGKLTNKEFHLIHNYPQAKQVIKFEKEYDIIYQGAINKGRCVQELISIAVKNNYKVCICGDGDEFEEIKKMSKGHKNIYLKGMVAPSKLHEFTCKSKIGYNFFEVLSKSYDESMSNKTFDYMQARIPQIISYSKAIDGLNKIKPFALAVNKEGLDAGIKQLLQSEQLYNKLQENIDELRLKYIWEKEELKLIQLYAEIK